MLRLVRSFIELTRVKGYIGKYVGIFSGDNYDYDCGDPLAYKIAKRLRISRSIYNPLDTEIGWAFNEVFVYDEAPEPGSEQEGGLLLAYQLTKTR